MLISLIKTDRVAELILCHVRNNREAHCNIMHTMPAFAALALTSISQPYIAHTYIEINWKIQQIHLHLPSSWRMATNSIASHTYVVN